MSQLIHSALKTWAKIGIAPGYLYQTVDQLKSPNAKRKSPISSVEILWNVI